MFFHLAHGVFAKMENAGRQHRIGFAFLQDIHHVVEITCPATGHHRYPNILTDAPDNLDVVARLGAIRINAVLPAAVDSALMRNQVPPGSACPDSYKTLAVKLGLAATLSCA